MAWVLKNPVVDSAPIVGPDQAAPPGRRRRRARHRAHRRGDPAARRALHPAPADVLRVITRRASRHSPAPQGRRARPPGTGNAPSGARRGRVGQFPGTCGGHRGPGRAEEPAAPPPRTAHFQAGLVDVREGRRREAQVHRAADRRRVRRDPAHDLPGASAEGRGEVTGALPGHSGRSRVKKRAELLRRADSRPAPVSQLTAHETASVTVPETSDSGTADEPTMVPALPRRRPPVTSLTTPLSKPVTSGWQRSGSRRSPGGTGLAYRVRGTPK